MKKLFLLPVFALIINFSGFSQDNQKQSNDFDEGQNELKINMTNLIIFKFADFTYERILNEESAVGVGLLYNLDTDNDGLNAYRTFSLTPYYRHYFSRQYAEGFFVEGFTMLHTGTDEFFDEAAPNPNDPSGFGVFRDKTFTDLAVGISAGFKAVSKRGFVAEIYLGIGRDLLGNTNDDVEVVGRGGISLGYRF